MNSKEIYQTAVEYVDVNFLECAYALQDLNRIGETKRHHFKELVSIINSGNFGSIPSTIARNIILDKSLQLAIEYHEERFLP